MTVNIGARLQQYARPDRVVVDALTAAKITPRFSIHNIGEVEIHGREKGLRIFEVFFDIQKMETQTNPIPIEELSLEEEFYIR